MNLFLFTIDKSDKKKSTFINGNSVFKSRKLTDEVNTYVKTNKSALAFYQFRCACKNFTPTLKSFKKCFKKLVLPSVF